MFTKLSIVDLEFARIFAELEDLRAQGVALTIYPYEVDPRRVIDALAGINSSTLTLTELFDRHPSARMALATDARELVNPFTLEPWEWASDLTNWPRRALFTSLPSADWGRVESAIHHGLGFSIASSRENGLQRLSALLGGSGPVAVREAARSTVTPVFAASPDLRYVADGAPSEDERKALLLELRLHLGSSAFTWFAVCAFFPALTPEIALYFGRQIASVTGAASEKRMTEDYARLAGLPWMRYGYMPDWMRRLVIRTLPANQQRAARKIAASILDAANLTSDRPTIVSANPTATIGNAPVVIPIRLGNLSAADALAVDDLTIEFFSEGDSRDINPLFELTPERIKALAEKHDDQVMQFSSEGGSSDSSQFAELMPEPIEVSVGKLDGEVSQFSGEGASHEINPLSELEPERIEEPAEAQNSEIGPGRRGHATARIFISHSSRDNEAAARMKAWLASQGFENAFLDKDKTTGIPPGADWEKTLYREVEQSQAVIIIQTPNWLASKWCFAEFTQARALGKAIFPVIEAPTGGTRISPDIQALDLISDREGGLERLTRELVRIALDAQGGFAWDAEPPAVSGAARLPGRGRRDLFRPRRRHPPPDRAARGAARPGRRQADRAAGVVGIGEILAAAGGRHPPAETRRPQLDRRAADAATHASGRRAGAGAGGGQRPEPPTGEVAGRSPRSPTRCARSMTSPTTCASRPARARRRS